ncbi:MAG: hypothetical protein WCX21_07045, partial [Bacteroidales bacterium]
VSIFFQRLAGPMLRQHLFCHFFCRCYFLLNGGTVANSTILFTAFCTVFAAFGAVLAALGFTFFYSILVLATVARCAEQHEAHTHHREE